MDAKGRFLFSQRRGNFAANAWFRSGWAILQPISQLRNEEGGLRKGTHVPKGGFAAVKPPTKWVFGCENWSFKALGISQPISQLQNEGGCEMALMCQGVVSQLLKFSQRGGMGLRNHFAAKGRFRSQGLISQRASWGCEKGHFRKGFLWAAKSRRPWIFPCFWTFFYSKRPSFNFFAIPPKLDHSKRLSYI